MKEPYVRKQPTLVWDRWGVPIIEWDPDYPYLPIDSVGMYRHQGYSEEYISERNEKRKAVQLKKKEKEDAEEQRRVEEKQKCEEFIAANQDAEFPSYLYWCQEVMKYAPSTIKRKMREKRKAIAAKAAKEAERKAWWDKLKEIK